MKRISVLLLLISSTAFGSGFDDRVQAAKQLSATPEGAKYEQSMGPAIGKAMQTCVPAGSTSPANLGTFTLVAFVSPSGSITDVEFQPTTAVSKCFTAQFQQLQLPAPPAQSVHGIGYPIEVTMKVVP